MSRVLLFNPENDTALAADTARYTPPRAAVQLHIDGSLLPLWWAREGDIVLSPHEDAAERLCNKYGLKGTVAVRIDPVESANITECIPWGWSADARHQFLDAGVPESALPSTQAIGHLRRLSHRRTTIPILTHLANNLDNTLHELIPQEITDISTLPRDDIFVKLPWSSSGRGVKHYPPGTLNPKTLDSIEGAIHRYGSVMAERALDKVVDFAALFFSEGGRVQFRGLSLFSTDPRGAYLGNIVAPEPQLISKITQYIGAKKIESACRALEDVLTTLISPSYQGWMGVDMMIYRRADGSLALQPCVELNLRMTMGVVAHIIAQHPALRDWLPARYAVGPSADGIDLLEGESHSRFHFTLQTL